MESQSSVRQLEPPILDITCNLMFEKGEKAWPLYLNNRAAPLEEARRNAQNRASNLHGPSNLYRWLEEHESGLCSIEMSIIEDGGTPTMLKLYLGYPLVSVDKITGEYTYPDNNTKSIV
ncbi:uncharacterized protein A4U43_C06F11480 [Asparagus officinalis]|uniref:Uncharacterized protein n=1 Tax=Asparagus officinalis TaxID=4686 RepID=A0A5P1EL71_ASPOF|nr:uncharacterized protein A4U43_C06F11480 [Asparagus officinalis]